MTLTMDDTPRVLQASTPPLIGGLIESRDSAAAPMRDTAFFECAQTDDLTRLSNRVVFAGVAAVQSWNEIMARHLAPTPATMRISANRLLQEFNNSVLNQLRQGAKPNPKALSQVIVVLSEVVRSDQPTPQVSLADDGAVEVYWLVGGERVELCVESDGSGTISAIARDGNPLLEVEFDGFDRPLESPHLEWFRAHLDRMAPRVRNRRNTL